MNNDYYVNDNDNNETTMTTWQWWWRWQDDHDKDGDDDVSAAEGRWGDGKNMDRNFCVWGVLYNHKSFMNVVSRN